MKFLSELRKRNFCKVGVVYVVTAWLAWQIVVLAVENIALPDWTMPAFRLAIWACFPVVMVAAWFLELTPSGFKLQRNVDPAESIARKTGRQLNRGFIMILVMALVLYLTDRFRDQLWSGSEGKGSATEATGQVDHSEAGKRFVASRRSEIPSAGNRNLT